MKIIRQNDEDKRPTLLKLKSEFERLGLIHDSWYLVEDELYYIDNFTLTGRDFLRFGTVMNYLNRMVWTRYGFFKDNGFYMILRNKYTWEDVVEKLREIKVIEDDCS